MRGWGCDATYIVNAEIHICRRRRRHRGRHLQTFTTFSRDYNGRVLATSKAALRWTDWRPE